MTEWYYASGGQQGGPVSFEQLVELARNGSLDPVKDLVWSAAMKDWTPSGQISGLFAAATTTSNSAAPTGDPANPYAAPASSWTEAATVSAGEALEEIVPGSELIDVTGCVKRGFDLTVRHCGMMLAVFVVFFAITIVSAKIFHFLDRAAGFTHASPISAFTTPPLPIETDFSPTGHPMIPRQTLLSRVRSSYTQDSGPIQLVFGQILSLFLTLGITRIGLNVVSGKEFSFGMLFGGGGKLLPALGASLLYWLMVIVGLVMLIVPGVYLALRYGKFLTAIVDRDMGVMDSFSYSSSLTTNNRMNLLLLALLDILISLAGCLALCVGMLFAIPVVWLSAIVAYRWLQYGPRAAMDHPGTTTPMLAGR